MKYYDWDKEKNRKLKRERGISFDDVLVAIEANKLLNIINHPNNKRYPNQKIYIVNINEYAYIIPFVEDEKKYFLKTIIPSRKMSKKYLKGGENV